jgi:hypothetical protein
MLLLGRLHTERDHLPRSQQVHTQEIHGPLATQYLSSSRQCRSAYSSCGLPTTTHSAMPRVTATLNRLPTHAVTSTGYSLSHADVATRIETEAQPHNAKRAKLPVMVETVALCFVFSA